MKKIRIAIAVTLFTFVATFNSFAQNPASILSKAQNALLAQGGAQVNFTSKINTPGRSTIEVVNGTLHIQGENFRLEYGDIVAAYSGRLLSYYDSTENTLTMSTPSQDELLQINPLIFLASQGKGYKVVENGQFKGGYSLRFIPIKKTGVKFFTAQFYSNSSLPGSVNIETTDGSKIDIKLRDVMPGRKYADSVFRLNRSNYPKVEVIDLR
ncbi:LolA family protein [Porphyromonas pogonae]|uniref:LolA family protein n=1 Tax=Porphyromonas pogonae TaxID=867595 RepID=UPI002E79175C|nr:LolA-like putative outer membrane lipoprotein chaperone [Porphyromonas pogonae]